MTDAEHAKAQTTPLHGEGPEHFRSKQRLAHILNAHKFDAEFEHRFNCAVLGLQRPLQYRTDVFGISEARQICIEVNGPRGHKTARAFAKDNLKKRRITEGFAISPRDYYTFSSRQIVGKRAWTDKEIEKEMNLITGIAATK